MSNFNDKAKSWDNKPMRVERAKQIAFCMEKYIKKKKLKGIEFGCGTGLLGFLLKDHFEKLYMADTSDGMLEVLKEKITQNSINNMFPIKINLLNENFDKKVDVVFSLMLLHHIEDIDNILKKWVELLNDNGLLIISDIDEEDGTYHKDGNTIHNGINRFELIKKMENLGLKNIISETAYVVRKEVEGEMKDFPVFIIVSKK